MSAAAKTHQPLSPRKIELLADSWHEYATKLQTNELSRHEAARKSIENPVPTFPEMYHEMMHSNNWRPLIAQENKYAVILNERKGMGASLLAKVQSTQRAEFQNFVRAEYANMLAARKPNKKQEMKKQESQDFREDDIDFLPDEGDLTMAPSRREGSYTVHLGGQLKKVMNVRLIAAETLSFMKRDLKTAFFDPLRLQTCMNLYANNLQGMVLILDEWDVWRGVWKDISQICALWPELHFDSLEDQLSHARALKEKWESGDVLTTKHSNFLEVHVLFHVLLTGNKMDSLESEDINGRHPAILALRNVMRQVWDFDLSVITLPLFLLRQYHGFMTSAWCQKRAELVFKCVKGFMIEMSSLADDEEKVVQFLLPDNTPESIFQEMNEMVTTIFRSPNATIRSPVNMSERNGSKN
ncbi:protein C12orf4 homolog [Paramacrobiotus metropolitanus]|uniref:protein C12orf4 homolog n=1 Tax=Paramacrobiotus metropolitanus TaxID=2943436 RepID=UPI0024460D34|nr:protein C12orf4 homolog [Paramacrobiotus metropolitanus]